MFALNKIIQKIELLNRQQCPAGPSFYHSGADCYELRMNELFSDIRKIRLVQFLEQIVLETELKNGRKKIYKIVSKEIFNELIDWLKNQEGLIHNKTIEESWIKSQHWEKNLNTEYYDNRISKIYRDIHKKIIEIIIPAIRRSRANDKRVWVIDIGCGCRPTMLLGLYYLLCNDPNIMLTGVDFSDNIKACKKQAEKTSLQFLCADLIAKDFPSIVREIFQEHGKSCRTDDDSIFLIASGVLTEHVFPHSLACLRFIQQALAANVTQLIISGYADNLMNGHLAKRVGFSLKEIHNSQENYSHENNRRILVYEQIPLDKIVFEYAIKLRSLAKGYLDLSKTTEPLKILIQLAEQYPDTVASVYSLDLSFCYLDLDRVDEKELLNILQRYPNLETIKYHSHRNDTHIVFFLYEALLGHYILDFMLQAYYSFRLIAGNGFFARSGIKEEEWNNLLFQEYTKIILFSKTPIATVDLNTFLTEAMYNFVYPNSLASVPDGIDAENLLRKLEEDFFKKDYLPVAMFLLSVYTNGVIKGGDHRGYKENHWIRRSDINKEIEVYRTLWNKAALGGCHTLHRTVLNLLSCRVKKLEKTNCKGLNELPALLEAMQSEHDKENYVANSSFLIRYWKFMMR